MTPDLNRLQSLIAHSEALVPSVSAWSVGQHVHHCLLGTREIALALAQSQPGAQRPTFSLLRWVVLRMRWIPRGRGQSPDSVLPDPHIARETLAHLAVEAAQAVQRARETSPDSWWRHFAFGVMNRDAALRFIAIHNDHHGKIARDILRAAKARVAP
ncbi:MAG: DinB family protein [Planctomycetota bacterium]